MKCFIIIFILFLLVAILGIIYCLIEAHLLVTSFAKLSKSKTTKNDTSVFLKEKNSYSKSPSVLSNNKENLRILYFSDVHKPFCFISPVRIIKKIEKYLEHNTLDAVIFGGDLCNNKKSAEKAVDYINEISMYCKYRGIPFLGINGNHDVKLEDYAFGACEFFYLDNAIYSIKGFNISGVRDSGRYPRIWADSKFKSHDKTNIIISHNPDWLLYASEKSQLDNIDYMISGHVHGGQIRLPFGIENKIFRKDALPKRNVVKGVFDGAGIRFFISKGIGCIMVPFRFLSRPEMTFIEIEK